MSTVSVDQEGRLSLSAARQVFEEAVGAAKAGDRVSARTSFERVTNAQPGILEAWLWRAHLATGPHEQITYLRRARAIDPNNAQTRAGLVRALIQAGIDSAKAGAKPEARRFLTEATQLDPTQESAWLWLVSLAETPSEKLRYLEKVLALHPMHEQASVWKAELEEKSASSIERPPKILVVDDSITVRSLVERTLRRRGCIVVMAADAAEALERLGTVTPDLIFLDIDLPDTDGFELCKRIKSRAETHDIPVLMLSGKDSAFDKLHGRMAGAVDHVSKPFRPDDLVEALKPFFPHIGKEE